MKVGKAIYNILSQSTDVQSNFPFNTTDYSPTGTDLVTNGDFSATGADLISNGDFSATGSDVIVDGDFPPASTAWSLVNATLESGGARIDNGATTDNAYILQALTNSPSGKSFVLTYDVIATDGGTLQIEQLSSLDLDTATTGTNRKFYFTWNRVTNDQLVIKRKSGTSVDITIDNVRLEELGEDWDNPDNAATYGENGLTISTSSGSGSYKDRQSSISLYSGKSYKVTYTIHAVNLTGSNVLQYYNGVGYQSFSEQGVGTHTEYFTRIGTDSNLWWYFKISAPNGSTTDTVTISSIVVQELGEDWTIINSGTASSYFGENKVQLVTSGDFTNVTQLQTIDLGKSYKYSFEIVDFVTGSAIFQIGGVTVATETGNGVYSGYYTSPTGDDHFEFKRSGATDLGISNISVEEMVLNKIFPELAPPDIDAPYVVYSVVSNSPSETKNANGDIDTASIEVYGFQDTYNKAVDLGVSIRAALDRKTGTYNTIEIQSTNYVNEQMDVNEARKLWAAIQDYSIRIKNI